VRTPCVALFLIGVLGIILPARAEIHQLGRIHDGVGAMSTNTAAVAGGAYRQAGAGNQPGGIATLTNVQWTLHAGFLQAVDIKQPWLDTDGNGVPDEMDPDNDGDYLPDWAEVDGSGFEGYARTDPNDPDTDGDGMTDYRESVGMYDPLDPDHYLHILSQDWDENTLTLWWIGKAGGTTNTILWGESLLDGAPTNIQHSAAYSGGDAPWYKATNSFAWFEAKTSAFLRVRTRR